MMPTADSMLTARAAALLSGVAGARPDLVRARWNPRLRSTAGRAFARANVVELNPRLAAHPGEVERTLRHELAHLLVAWRAGKWRRRPEPHGPEWRRACADLGIADETRCHRLELAPRRQVARRHVYRCAGCRAEWRRVRPIPRRRPLACRACCRAHAGGRFDRRFLFVPVIVVDGGREGSLDSSSAAGCPLRGDEVAADRRGEDGNQVQG